MNGFLAQMWANEVYVCAEGISSPISDVLLTAKISNLLYWAGIDVLREIGRISGNEARLLKQGFRPCIYWELCAIQGPYRVLK